MRVQSLALLSGLSIRRCGELRCRSQTRLRSHIAVAVVQASSYSSDYTPSLGTSICRRCSPKKTKENEEKKRKDVGRSFWPFPCLLWSRGRSRWGRSQDLVHLLPGPLSLPLPLGLGNSHAGRKNIPLCNLEQVLALSEPRP